MFHPENSGSCRKQISEVHRYTYRYSRMLFGMGQVISFAVNYHLSSAIKELYIGQEVTLRAKINYTAVLELHT